MVGEQDEGVVFRFLCCFVEVREIQGIVRPQVLHDRLESVYNHGATANDALDERVVCATVVQVEKDEVLGEQEIILLVVEVRQFMDRIKPIWVIDQTALGAPGRFDPSLSNMKKDFSESFG